jgi:hypothetical protein
MAVRTTRKPPEVLRADAGPEILIATSSGVIKLGGTLHRYYAGITKIRADHPLARKFPDRFAPMKIDIG